jgi:hypothetical protein
MAFSAKRLWDAGVLRRPKALCYEDIQMMIVRHPTTGRCMPAMAIKFVHHKGADNKPKPYISRAYYPKRRAFRRPVY